MNRAKNQKKRDNGLATTPVPLAPIAARVNTKVVWGMVGGAVAAIATIGAVVLDHYLNTPKMEGNILFTSLGSVPGHRGVGSIAMIVSLQSTGEASIVPINYKLRVRLGGVWHEASLHRQLKENEKVAVLLPGNAPRPLLEGDWTACFSKANYLMNPARLAKPITGKPTFGLLLFRMANVDAVGLMSRDEMQLTVITAGGAEYDTYEGGQKHNNYEFMKEYLISQAELLPGFSECP